MGILRNRGRQRAARAGEGAALGMGVGGDRQRAGIGQQDGGIAAIRTGRLADPRVDLGVGVGPPHGGRRGRQCGERHHAGRGIGQAGKSIIAQPVGMRFLRDAGRAAGAGISKLTLRQCAGDDRQRAAVGQRDARRTGTGVGILHNPRAELGRRGGNAANGCGSQPARKRRGDRADADREGPGVGQRNRRIAATARRRLADAGLHRGIGIGMGLARRLGVERHAQDARSGIGQRRRGIAAGDKRRLRSSPDDRRVGSHILVDRVIDIGIGIGGQPFGLRHRLHPQ